MRNIFKIALSNIRKRKSAAVTLSAMILIAALLFTMAFSIILGSRDYYFDKTEELQSPHAVMYVAESLWDTYDTDGGGNKITDFIGGYETTEVSEAEYGARITGDIFFGGIPSSYYISFLDAGIERKISPLDIIDRQQKPFDDKSIILPLFVKLQGYKAGADFKIKVNETEYVFNIYGFIEDAELGSPTYSMKNFYISGGALDAFRAASEFENARRVSVRFTKPEDSGAFVKSVMKEFNFVGTSIMVIDYSTASESAVSFVGIITVIFLLFAAVIFIVSLIIIRFSIINSIDGDAKNYGALKSAGYTTKQIMAAMLLQYSMLALAAALLGGGLGLIGTPLVGGIISGSSGLLWVDKVFFAALFLSAGIVCAVTAATVLLTGRKIKKVTPVGALRSGLDVSGKRKSMLPMPQSRLPLNLNLGMKTMLCNFKNNITVFLVVALFVFSSLVTQVLNYNFTKDKAALIAMIGIDPRPQITFITDDFQAELGTLNADSRVERLVLAEGGDAFIGDLYVGVQIFGNYAEKELSAIYQGRYPGTANEASIGYAAAKNLGLKIGDTVTVETSGEAKDFLITGIEQSLANSSMGFSVTAEGFARFVPGITLKTYEIFLYDKADTDAFIKEYSLAFSGAAMLIDGEKTLNTICDSLATTFSMIFYVVFVSTLAVISLILFLMISTLIRKNKKQYGIFKAVGFKNSDLIKQIIFAYIPIVLLGAAAGLIIGCFAANPFITLAMGSFGVVSATYLVPLPSLIGLTLLITGLSAAITLLVSLKTRRISAYKLIVE